MKPICFVDVETTGGSPTTDRVTEIGIVRVENGQKIAEYSSLVNPGTHIPYFIQQLTGINQMMIDTAPFFDEIKKNVKEILDGAIFLAHNARFDYSFVQSEFKRFDDTYKAKVVCTVRLSRSLFPDMRKHSLSSLITRFNIDVRNRHRALDDAQALWDFYEIARNQVGDKLFFEKFDFLLKGPQVPAFLKAKSFGSFPDVPGVYKFLGRTNEESDGELLYIGKSNSLKSRIYSHFSPGNSITSDINLAKFVKDIEIMETPGHFGAMLLEAHLIKEKMPLLNKQLRKTNTYLFLVSTTHGKYRTIKIQEDNDVSPAEHAKILGVHKSKASLRKSLAQACQDYALCPKLLGLEKTNRACFASQIGKCKGACTNSEKPLTYNMRFAQSFADTKIKPWPFAGAIVFHEERDGKVERHLIYNWSHLATIKINEDNEPIVTKYEYKFDYDIYKIVKKFTSRRKYISKVESDLEKKIVGEVTGEPTLDQLHHLAEEDLYL